MVISRLTFFIGHLFLCGLLLALTPAGARADLSSSQARKAIQRLAGASLPSDAVRVHEVRMETEGAQARAELHLVFRVTQHEGRWRLREVRTGPERWERIEYLALAADVRLAEPDCDAPSQFASTVDTTELTTKRARCLVAALFGVTLPSDDVRIREVSPFGFSFGSADASALVDALVKLDFGFVRDRGGWQVALVKSGDRKWTDVRDLLTGIDQLKRFTATNELTQIAQALDSYRRDRGSYVVSDKESVLIDHLSPRYLTPVIRLDPWSRPYQYDGEQTRYSLRSLGPDGKPNTGDDIVVKN